MCFLQVQSEHFVVEGAGGRHPEAGGQSGGGAPSGQPPPRGAGQGAARPAGDAPGQNAPHGEAGEVLQRNKEATGGGTFFTCRSCVNNSCFQDDFSENESSKSLFIIQNDLSHTMHHEVKRCLFTSRPRAHRD